jgi:histidinol-phosphate aminotransferase
LTQEELFALTRRADLSRYPSPTDLEALIARSLDVDPARVVVTAGGDEAIDRVCRAFLEPGRQLLTADPTFEMITKYATLAGGSVRAAAWGESFPTQALLEIAGATTGVIAVVTPNNPTGRVVRRDDLERLSSAAPGSVLLVDLAYTEFAEEDLTSAALSLPNAIAIRTFSKAFGLAGLRVGYAVAPASLVSLLRAAGGPFSVSALSIAAAFQLMQDGAARVAPIVARVAQERSQLATMLGERGVTSIPSQANFVLARFPDAEGTWAALARRGILVRKFASPELAEQLRITCPADCVAWERLKAAIDEVLEKRA